MSLLSLFIILRRRRQHDVSITGATSSSTGAGAATTSSHLSSRTATTATPSSANHSGGRDLVIGDPVLVSHFSASPRTMRMFPDELSSILSSQAVTQQMLNQFRRGATTSTTEDDHVSDGGIEFASFIQFSKMQILL